MTTKCGNLPSKGKRIVLYGIGMRTMAVRTLLEGFQIVGLMDRDPERQGDYILGVPILSLEEAEERGDVIVISANDSYYQVIYRRIRHTSLPVYFFSGEAAQAEAPPTAHHYSRELDWTWAELEEKARHYEVLSFDVFDTLVQRAVCSPNDVFQLLNLRLRREGLLPDGLHFAEMRSQSALALPSWAGIQEIYKEMERLFHLDPVLTGHILELELDLERKLLRPVLPSPGPAGQGDLAGIGYVPSLPVYSRDAGDVRAAGPRGTYLSFLRTAP